MTAQTLLQDKGRLQHLEFAAWYVQVDEAVHEFAELVFLVAEVGRKFEEACFDGFQLLHDGLLPKFDACQLGFVEGAPLAVHLCGLCASAEFGKAYLLEFFGAFLAAQGGECVPELWCEGSDVLVGVAAYQSSCLFELFLSFSADVPSGELQHDVEVLQQCLSADFATSPEGGQHDFDADVKPSLVGCAVQEWRSRPLPVVPEAGLTWCIPYATLVKNSTVSVHVGAHLLCTTLWVIHARIPKDALNRVEADNFRIGLNICFFHFSIRAMM